MTYWIVLYQCCPYCSAQNRSIFKTPHQALDTSCASFFGFIIIYCSFYLMFLLLSHCGINKNLEVIYPLSAPVSCPCSTSAALFLLYSLIDEENIMHAKFSYPI